MVAVAHIDHTSEPGGAELALARLLTGGPANWSPHLFLPPSTLSRSSGAFAEVSDGLITEIGVWQPAGAIGGGVLSQLALLGRAGIQAASLRINRGFRSAEVVHANTSRAALIGLLACVGSGRRLIVHLRDAIESQALGARNAKLLQEVVRRAAGVIGNSQYTLNSALPYMRAGAHSQVIPSPIGLAADRTVVPVNDQVRRIGMLARITEWKGQELVIRAFAEGFQGSSVVLELAGSPAFGQDAYLEHLKRTAADLGVGEQVHFLGHVSDIWPLIDAWDICVHASLHPEPLGQNVLQYLAAARPTIGAKAGGPVEWIMHGENGLLFDPGSQASLRDSLLKLADDHHLRAKISAALETARPVPSDPSVLRMYSEFFAVVAAS